MNEYLTVSEVAKKLGITERQVRRLCKDGKLQGAYKSGSRWVLPAFTSIERIKRYNLLDNSYIGTTKRIPIDFPLPLFDRIIKYCKFHGCCDFPEAVRFALMDFFDRVEPKKRRKNSRVHSSLDRLPVEVCDTLLRMVDANEWPTDFPDMIPDGAPRIEDMVRYCDFKDCHISKSAMGRFTKRNQFLQKSPVT